MTRRSAGLDPTVSAPYRARQLTQHAPRRAGLLVLSLALSACGGAATTVRAPSSPPALSAVDAPRPAPPTPDAIWVQLEPQSSDQRWSLRANDAKVLCELPCSHWVTTTAGEFLQYEIPGTNRALQVSFPNDLGAPGSTVTATARLSRATRGEGKELILGSSILLIGGMLVFGFLDQQGGSSVGDFVALGIAGASVPVFALGLYFLLTSHPPDVVVHTASLSPRPTFTLGPGYAEATSPTGLHLVLTPLGATGTF